MTEVVEVGSGGTVEISGTASTITGPTGGSAVTVDGPAGTVIEIEPGGEVVTSGGGATVITTGTTAIQIVETGGGPGGGGGGVSDHGALTGLDQDDHPQYLLADGARHVTDHALTSEEGFVVPGTGVSGWTFSVSPRVWEGVDYYTPGSIVFIAALQLGSGDWVDAMSSFASEDHPVVELPEAWTDGWDDLQLHLIDGTAIGIGKVTVVSNRGWPLVDAEFMALLGVAGLFTLDHTEVGWTWDGDTFAPVSDLAVCAPSGSTDFPDPPTVTAVTSDAFRADADGTVTAATGLTVPNAVVGVLNATTITVPAGGRIAMSGDATFMPPSFLTDTEPAVAEGDLAVWNDSTTDEWWLIVGTYTGNRKIQLT